MSPALALRHALATSPTSLSGKFPKVSHLLPLYFLGRLFQSACIEDAPAEELLSSDADIDLVVMAASSVVTFPHPVPLAVDCEYFSPFDCLDIR